MGALRRVLLIWVQECAAFRVRPQHRRGAAAPGAGHAERRGVRCTAALGSARDAHPPRPAPAAAGVHGLWLGGGCAPGRALHSGRSCPAGAAGGACRSPVGALPAPAQPPLVMRACPALPQLLQGSMGCGWVGAALPGVPRRAADRAPLALSHAVAAQAVFAAPYDTSAASTSCGSLPFYICVTFLLCISLRCN